MEPNEAYRILVRVALDAEGEQKLALLDVAAALGDRLGFRAEANAAAGIAAQLRVAGEHEDGLVTILERR